MLNNFETNLKKYAELIVQTGVNVSTKQTVVLQIDVEQQQLANLIVEEAYNQGASEVIVKWGSEFVQRQFIERANEKSLNNFPHYRTDEAEDWIKKGACRIAVVSGNPDNLNGIDPQRIASFQHASGKGLRNLLQASQANKISWTVVAAAGKEWAKKVFPKLSITDAQDALWDQIFKTTRIYETNPVEAWDKHNNTLQSKADELTNEAFISLHYTAPGTDITIGLPEGHLWEGASAKNATGREFQANMPTEEVFTCPDANRIDGVVSSTKPLSYGGTLITNMTFTFKNGKVVDFSADTGEDVLARLLDTDEGAKSLGEVALVPDPSPISQSGIVFYNTLFDENASNHLALGAAYPFNLKGGTEMNEDELICAGLNRSQTHVDFMIGSNKMNIDGIKKDGTIVPIFRNGDWA